jgi:hypothetical protein
VYVALKPFYAMRDGRDSVLKDTKSWVRLSVYEDRPSRCRYTHVNIDSDLTRLLRARIQEYSDGTSLFLVDYTSGHLARLPEVDAEGFYQGAVPIPVELQPAIGTGYPIKP